MKALEEFDFTQAPQIPAARIRELAEGGYIERSEPVVLIGECGTGKSHLATGLCLAACRAMAQTPRPGESSLELEPSLFVQLPGGKSIPGAVPLVWIPAPLEKYCLGKTHEQCASMDFCIRTTTKNVPTCRNLAVDLAHLPAYPPDMRPRRMLSIALLPPTRMKRLG